MEHITTYIRNAIEADPNGEPDVIAEVVLNALPQRKIRNYLLGLLIAQVKDVMRLDGNSARNAALNCRGGVTTSPKYKGRQEVSEWMRMLDSRIDIAGTLKRFGECTRDELTWCIKDREQRILELHNKIEQCRRVIDLLDRYNVNTPDELPEQEVA